MTNAPWGIVGGCAGIGASQELRGLSAQCCHEPETSLKIRFVHLKNGVENPVLPTSSCCWDDPAYVRVCLPWKEEEPVPRELVALSSPQGFKHKTQRVFRREWLVILGSPLQNPWLLLGFASFFKRDLKI